MLTDAQKQLFQSMARNQDWNEWLNAQEAEQIKVLKVARDPVQFAQAQGQAQLIDKIKECMSVK